MTKQILPIVKQGSEVPKIIYQTDARAVLPDDLRQNQQRLLALNAGWALECFDDEMCERFIEIEYGSEMLSVYRSIDANYAASRADLFRYLLIYKRGGAYLDIKSSASVPFDVMLSSGQSIILAQWDQALEEIKGWGDHPELKAIGAVECQQWHLIAAPGHPYLRHVILRVVANIKKYIPEIHGVGRHGVYRVTGPIAYSLALSDRITTQSIPTNTELGLVYSIYNSAKRHRDTNAKTHYSLLTTPIVYPTRQKRLLGRAFRYAQSTRNHARRALKRLTPSA